MTTQLKERPVVFTVEEVNAVLAGKKTQHRVILSSQPYTNDCGWEVLEISGVRISDQCATTRPLDEAINKRLPKTNAAPYRIGDRLWVQEDWRVGAWREIGGVLAIDYKASPEITNTPWVQVSDDEDGKKFEAVWIAVTDELDSKGVKTNDDGHYHWPAGQAPLDWSDASTMERWASRILLKITDIRIERVQDITLGDSLKEARDGLMDFAADYWMAKHGEAAWFTNPWVWVVEFKKVDD